MGLSYKLSTWVGNSHVNRVKFGETPSGTIPSEASIEERVETRRRAPKRIAQGEDIVQTTTQYYGHGNME